MLADDHAVILDGLNAMLEGEKDLEVIDHAHSGLAVMERMNYAPHPNLLVLDINMPGMDGIEVTCRLKEQYPQIKILILSMHSRKEFIKKLVTAGADGYILKNSGRAELLNAIRTIADGGTYFAIEIMKKGFSDHFSDNSTDSVQLSEREIDIIRYIASGLATSEIAKALDISVHTIGTHRKRILPKINARNTADITRYAIRVGIIKDFDGI